MQERTTKKLYIDDRFICEVHSYSNDHARRNHVYNGDAFTVVVPFNSVKRISSCYEGDIFALNIITVDGR